MDKNTQTILGVAAVAVVAYLLYQNAQKKKSFEGAVAGKRVKMVGFAAKNEQIKDSKWIRNADGKQKPNNIAPTFFDIKSTNW